MRTVSTREVATEPEAMSALPEGVREALGELAGAAREGLLALSVGVGLGVLHEIMEGEVDEVVGPKGKQNTERTAKRRTTPTARRRAGMSRRVGERGPRRRQASPTPVAGGGATDSGPRQERADALRDARIHAGPRSHTKPWKAGISPAMRV